MCSMPLWFIFLAVIGACFSTAVVLMLPKWIYDGVDAGLKLFIKRRRIGNG